MGNRPPYHEEKYLQYYLKQAENGLTGYEGSSSQYGAGIGGMFRSLFRMVIPLFKRGVSIAKPHLKSAAKNIIGDEITNITRPSSPQRQQGSAMIASFQIPTKCPPSSCGRTLPPTWCSRYIHIAVSNLDWTTMALLHRMSEECVKSELDLSLWR